MCSAANCTKDVVVMRALVVVLAILAGVKIWTHQSLFRAASEQALLKAYGSSAMASCQKTSRRGIDLLPNMRQAIDWSQVHSAKVVIGDDTVDVALWQVDHKDWAQRFKMPYIHLKVGQVKKPHVCIFNVMTGTATVLRT